LCGEKLSEGFVARVLDEVAARRGLSNSSCWPDGLARLDICSSPIADASAIADEVNGLRSSVHYDYCRRLGQLGPLQGIAVRQATEAICRLDPRPR